MWTFVTALEAAGRLGPFFELDTWRYGAGWRPLSELTSGPAVLAERVASARSVMAERTGIAVDEIDERAMASIVSLGLFARLLSPAFGAAVLADVVPSLTLAALWWRPVIGGPIPMAASPGTDDTEPFNERIVSGIVAPVLASFAAQFRLSEKVLWGNAASALGSAVGMITTARPDLADRAVALAEQALSVPPMAGTGTFERPDESDPRRFFVRRSCCLFYRIPGAGTCGDCVLTPEPVRRQQWQAALRR
jgi:hypothetical protein